MALFDRYFIRRQGSPRIDDLPPSVLRRLGRACTDLTSAEDALTERLGLRAPPRLLMIDEETAVVVPSEDRSKIGQG